MKKDFITATPDSGGSGSTTVTVASSRCENLRIAHNRILKHVESEHGSVVCHYDYRFERSYQTNRFSLHGYED